MFGNSQLERVRQLFADQFEPDGAGFLYRRNMKGAPIRVSAAERDAFIAEFKRNYGRTFWAVTFGTILVIVVLAFLVPDVDSAAGTAGTWGAVGLTIAAFLAAHYRHWGSPARALERRPVLGYARSREEIRSITLARLSYSQITFSVLFAMVTLWKAWVETGLHGWGIFWLVFAVAIVVLAIVQTFRKWRSERGPRL